MVSNNSTLRGCGNCVTLSTSSVIGTPQVRWREMHQSGRPAIMLVMRSSPQPGIQRTRLIAASASARRPALSMLMNHCGVARNATGVLWRQQCG